VAAVWSVANGPRDVAAQASVEPSANTSPSGPLSRMPSICSGAMKSGVPMICPVTVSRDASTARAIPKSITRGPPGESSTLAGFRSRLHQPGRVDRGQRLGEPAGQVGQGVLGHRPVGEHGVPQRRPFDELGGEPRRLAVRVGVEHARGEQAHDRRGRGDLPPEALPEAGVVGEVVADHLDGRAAPVRRGRGVDPAHMPPTPSLPTTRKRPASVGSSAWSGSTPRA
jgi:hypothetical protein